MRITARVGRRLVIAFLVGLAVPAVGIARAGLPLPGQGTTTTAPAQTQPPAAPAAPAAMAPANDARANATAIPALPSTQNGTTVHASVEPALDPPSPCGCNGPSVWYRYVAATNGTLTAELQAADPLDVTLDAFQQTRSTLTPLTSDVTDDKGSASLRFQVKAGQPYLIRVAQKTGSDAGTFVLKLGAAAAPARPPGVALGAGGATATLDRVLKPAVAYHYTMRAGHSYRIAMVPIVPKTPPRDPDDPDAAPVPAPQACRAQLDVYPPGTKDFDERSILSEPCDGYEIYTPRRGASGDHVLRVSAPDGARGAQRFHLQIAPAAGNDIAPGSFLDNHRKVAGALQGSGVNRTDLYRFSVRKRSQLKLALTGSSKIQLALTNDRGKTVGGGGDGGFDRAIRPGRYFVAVSVPAGTDARYKLQRSSRIITKTVAAISGQNRAHGHLGQTLSVGLRVRPAVSGTIRATVERFDPQFGWQYVKTKDIRASGGHAGFGLRPSAVGRWRVHAQYLGTRDAAPSESGYAQVLVTSRG